MSVQEQNPTQYFEGPLLSGSTLPITEFTFIDNSHVAAKVRGENVNWVYGTDYTVSGAGTSTRTITILKAVAADEIFAVFLDIPITQMISPEEGGNFPAAIQEMTLDKLTYICQMLYGRITRAVQVSIDSNFDGLLYDSASQSGKAIIINELGTGLSYSTDKVNDIMALVRSILAQIQVLEGNASASASTATTKAGEALASAGAAATAETNAGLSADRAEAVASTLENIILKPEDMSSIDISTYLLAINNGTLGDGGKITFGKVIEGLGSADFGNLLEIGSDGKLFAGLPTNVTTQGNTFNGNSQLVQTNSIGQLPVLDGSLLTGITVEEQNLIQFSVNSGKTDTDGKPDLLDITDTSKVVFNVDNGTSYAPLKGSLADGTIVNRTAIADLSVSALADGTYNLFVGADGTCIPLANTIIRQRKELTGSSYSQIATPEANAIDGGNQGASYNAAKAFDGNMSTRFESSQVGNSVSNKAYIGQQNLTKKVAKIRIYQGSSSSSTYCTYCDFKIQYSNDGTTWIDIQEVLNPVNKGWQEIIVDDFTPNLTGYKLRLLATSNTSTSSSWHITEIEMYEHVLTTGDVWLDTSVKPYQAKKYNGTTFEDFAYLPLPQNITVESGAITAKTLIGGYNVNEWDEQIMLPDYNYPTTLTNGAPFTAPVDGWVKNSVGMFVLYRGSIYTPASTGFEFYPMKGVA